MQRDLDYFRLLSEAKSLRIENNTKRIRLALLADCSTKHLIVLLQVLFRRYGIYADIYEGMFNAIELEVRNPSSGLYAFEPEIVVVLQSVQSLRDRFYLREDSHRFLDQGLSQLTGIWESITSNSNALIIQSTFVDPVERFFGNYDRKVDSSLSSLVSSINAFVIGESQRRRNILLLDLESLASWVGREHWFDERLWTLAKSLCSLEVLPQAAQNIVDIVLTTKGRTMKCIVLDLDNTLWGGIVGDDGPHGIQIGAHGDGEPFFRFQSFLKELKKRGILLAVCSKNEESNARKPFQENSEMVLTLDDIVVFVANWKNKPENIRIIQQELRIGFDSIVFIDDNPFERGAVRELLPDVIVPELPEDPGEWPKTLCELNLFETTSFSSEDTKRADLYQQEVRRRALVTTCPDFDEYLRSLDMTIEVARFASRYLGRIAQLLQRSNQFNLTTRRLNETECDAIMCDTGHIPLYAVLKDRFGDHGLISIVILRPDHEGQVLSITDWLMSCRVLGRGVEDYLMNYVVEQARGINASRIEGIYIPSAKNNMVKDFYKQNGFVHAGDAGGDATCWTLDITDYVDRPVFIRPAADATHAFTIAKG